MADIDLVMEWDSRDLEVLRGGHVERALRTALAKAGGDAIRGMRTSTSKRMRQRKRLKVARVRAGLPIHFPKNKSEISGLVWSMDVSGALVPVSDYPYRQTRQGVKVSINVGTTKLVRSAFVARMGSGHVGVFRRRGDSRLPIDEAFTTRLSDVVSDSGLIPSLQVEAQGRFTSTFTRVLPMELEKVRR